jgi:phosphate transport system substrate-binding protein
MLKQKRVAFLLGIAMALSLIFAACGGGSTTGSGSTPTSSSSSLGTPGTYNCVSGNITADGSTALQPLVTAVAKQYQTKCSGASIVVNLGGSKTGLSDAEAGNVQIGDSDIFAASTQSDLVDHQVAVVIFTIVINSKVTGVTNLTTAQLKGIYSGSITNWSQVGGPNLKIVVVSRPISSGTRATFQTYILGGPETVTGPASLVSDSTGTVATEVNETDGAIGYVALGAAKQLNLTTVSIDGNAPTPTLVESNTYKFWNIEHMYTKGAATGLAEALIDYMTSSDAQTIASGLSFLTINQMSPSAISAHQPTT